MSDYKIKFNVWDKFEDKLILWDDIITNRQNLLIEGLLNLTRYEPLQHTEIEDRNGVIDVDGDIVKVKIGNKLYAERTIYRAWDGRYCIDMPVMNQNQEQPILLASISHENLGCSLLREKK